MIAAGFEACRAELGLSVFDLWLAYFVLGGVRNAEELDGYLGGDGSSDADHDTLIHALNEEYVTRGRLKRLAYRAL